jgi:hypothetical protein
VVGLAGLLLMMTGLYDDVESDSSKVTEKGEVIT